MLVLASETGVLDIPPERVVYKGRLQPGRILLIDTEEGRIISDDEAKDEIASEHPYGQWLDEHLTPLKDLPAVEPKEPPKDHDKILQRQQAFGYTFEDQRIFLGPMSKIGRDPVGSMGNDASLAVLSDRPQLLYNYFKQLFAQVTNPPLDPLKEEIITSSETTIGTDGTCLCQNRKVVVRLISTPQLFQMRS